MVDNFAHLVIFFYSLVWFLRWQETFGQYYLISSFKLMLLHLLSDRLLRLRDKFAKIMFWSHDLKAELQIGEINNLLEKTSSFDWKSISVISQMQKRNQAIILWGNWFEDVLKYFYKNQNVYINLLQLDVMYSHTQKIYIFCIISPIFLVQHSSEY